MTAMQKTIVLETPTVDAIIASAEAATKTTNLPMTVGKSELTVADPMEVQRDKEVLLTAFQNSDTNGIMLFASEKQRQSTAAAEVLLEGARHKDLGPAASGLNNIVTTIRTFDLTPLRDNKVESSGGFLGWGAKKITPVARWLNSYTQVEGGIETVVNKLRKDQMTMLEDVEKLDRMYEAQVEYFRGLEAAIEGGVQALSVINDVILPELQKTAAESTDPLAGAKYNDKIAMRDRAERRVHDLRLTREIIRQGLPGIRTTQESDASLAEKIESIIVNTIPLWKQQMAVLVATARTREVAQSIHDVMDVTDELLRQGADQVKDANVLARRALERGILSIETVEYVNQQMIDMIVQTQEIYTEAKVRRAEEVKRMAVVAQALKEAHLKSS